MTDAGSWFLVCFFLFPTMAWLSNMQFCLRSLGFYQSLPTLQFSDRYSSSPAKLQPWAFLIHACLQHVWWKKSKSYYISTMPDHKKDIWIKEILDNHSTVSDQDLIRLVLSTKRIIPPPNNTQPDRIVEGFKTTILNEI
nr:hypothetical protein Iba_chr03bCG15250 [Ipomoea batatas]